MVQIKSGDIERLLSSGRFDAEWYSETYPDVRASGMGAAEHYLWLGARLGRQPGPPASLVDRPATVRSAGAIDVDTLDAVFLDGTNGTSSTPYRVFRIADGLAREGWKVRCLKGEDLFSLNADDVATRFLIVHRAPYWSPYVEFVNALRAKGTIIVYDIDDLVFDESVIPHIDGYKYLSEDSRDGFLKGLRAYRDFISHADMCTTTTGFLADEIAKLGKPTYTVRNAISVDNIKLFDSIGYQRQIRPKPFVVGYYSGTKTHQADFAVAATALIQFMRENPDVVFRLVGEFDLDAWPELSSWQHIHRPGDVPRVTRVGLMPHDVMVRDQLSCDLILAPLETGNPFCEAKSELKFFEASLASVPVIASGTRTFVEASLNGLLAELAITSDDWLAAMRRIYGDYPAAIRKARNAFFNVRYGYSQQYATTQALEAYEEFAARRAGIEPKRNETENPSGRVADIAVILPDFSGPSGGHRKIFTVCKALEQHGLRVKLYFYTNRDAKAIRRDISRFFFDLWAEIAPYGLAVDPHKVVICTQWKTIYDFISVDFDGRVISFVQDFEPMFYSVGSDYIRAIAGYRQDFDIICYGQWVAAKLKDELGVRSLTIPFTMDHKVYRAPEVEQSRDIDILLFAKPSQDRRCFDLISEGLVKLQAQRPEIRIGLFGEEEYFDVAFEFTNFGVFSDLAALRGLYQRTKVGICYSPTNPSQLGYEMIACGACLIDVRVKFFELNFGGEGFVQYSDGTPEDMRDACLALLDDPADRARRQKLGYEYIRAMPDDDTLGESFIRIAGLN